MPGQRERLSIASKAAARRLPTKKALLGRVIGEGISSFVKSKRDKKREAKMLKREDDLLERKFQMEKELMRLKPKTGKYDNPMMDDFMKVYQENYKGSLNHEDALGKATDYITGLYTPEQIFTGSQQLYTILTQAANKKDDKPVEKAGSLQTLLGISPKQKENIAALAGSAPVKRVVGGAVSGAFKRTLPGIAAGLGKSAIGLLPQAVKRELPLAGSGATSLTPGARAAQAAGGDVIGNTVREMAGSGSTPQEISNALKEAHPEIDPVKYGLPPAFGTPGLPVLPPL